VAGGESNRDPSQFSPFSTVLTLSHLALSIFNL
jgi:hypothetical protein